MKKRNSLAILCSAVFCLSLALVGCNDQPHNLPGTDVAAEWTVTFDSQGGSAVEAQLVADGEKAKKPTNPTKEGFDFLGWFEEKAAVTAFDFNTPITTNWTLYAGWKRGSVTPPEPPEEDYDYFVMIGRNMVGMSEFSGDQIDGKVGEYKASFPSVTENDTIEFYNADRTAIYDRIGPDAGDNNAISTATGFAIHNTASNVDVYLKIWSDGGHSFWVTGYDGGVTPPEPSQYYVIVNGAAYDYYDNGLDGCPENQTGNYSTQAITVNAGDSVQFMKPNDIEIIENIGSEPEDDNNHNNIIGTPGSYVTHNAGEMTIYFKTWNDGGFSFWGTGYQGSVTPPEPEAFKVLIGFTAYELIDIGLDGCPDNQRGNYKAEIAHVEYGEIVSFIDYYDQPIIENIGSEPEDENNHNLVVGTPGDYMIHNDAENVECYFKTWTNGGYSFWMTGYQAEEPEPSDYSLIIGEETYTFVDNGLDGCPQNQIGNYSATVNAAVTAGQEVRFNRDGIDIIERIGSEPEDENNHNNIVGNPGNFSIHNNASSMTVYLKAWEDGGYSFWGTGYEDLPDAYRVDIGTLSLDLLRNPDPVLADHQVAEYMYLDMDQIFADDDIVFYKNDAIITQIGTGTALDNNATGDAENGFKVRADAEYADIYLKQYDDGGYDFYLTGYEDRFKINVAGIDYDLELNQDFVPNDAYSKEYFCEFESISGGDVFSFTNNYADISDLVRIEGGRNNVTIDNEYGYTMFHNDAADAKVYFKVGTNGTYGVWVEGFELVNDYCYEVTGCPDWIQNDGCVIFAWTWRAGTPDQWVQVYFVNSTTIELGVDDQELDGFLLVRCAAGTTQPNWGEHNNVAGRIYNQTGDITCSSGTYSYACPEWRGYNPS